MPASVRWAGRAPKWVLRWVPPPLVCGCCLRLTRSHHQAPSSQGEASPSLSSQSPHCTPHCALQIEQQAGPAEAPGGQQQQQQQQQQQEQEQASPPRPGVAAMKAQLDLYVLAAGGRTNQLSPAAATLLLLLLQQLPPPQLPPQPQLPPPPEQQHHQQGQRRQRQAPPPGQPADAGAPGDERPSNRRQVRMPSPACPPFQGESQPANSLMLPRRQGWRFRVSSDVCREASLILWSGCLSLLLP